jgi:hypothetical protein
MLLNATGLIGRVSRLEDHSASGIDQKTHGLIGLRPSRRSGVDAQPGTPRMVATRDISEALDAWKARRRPNYLGK